MGRGRTRVAIALCALLGASLLAASFAAAGRNQYHVEAVTIRVDRDARVISGKVIANSVDVHFCTSSNQWPLNVWRVRRGRDEKIFHTRTNFDAAWRFKVRSPELRGRRVYAQVPSFPNPANGYCNGARSRIVTAP